MAVSARSGLVVALLALAACTPAQPLAPAASQPPGSPAPSAPTASPVATPVAVETVVPSLSTAQVASLAGRRPELEQRLLALAKATFASARARLVDRRGALSAAERDTWLAPGASPAPYRLAVAAPYTIDPSPRPGETLEGPIIWPDGSSLRLLELGSPREERRIELDGTGSPIHQTSLTDVTLHPNGRKKTLTDTQTVLATPDGAFGLALASHETYDDDGRLAAIAYDQALLHDPTTGIEIAFDHFEADLHAGTGNFRRTLRPYGLVEDGQWDRALPAPGAPFYLAFDNPLIAFNGHSVTSDGTGAALFEQHQAVVANPLALDLRYDLLDGFVLAFRLATDATTVDGAVLLDGVPAGTVRRAIAPGGAVTFTLSLVDQPDRPLVVQFGDAPAPSPVAPPPALDAPMFTLAGAGRAGFVDGQGQIGQVPGAFDTPTGVATLDGKTFYVADFRNNRIRVVHYGEQPANRPDTLAVETLAGAATAGGTDGPGQAARFDGPVTLALDPGRPALYVAELRGERVRRIDLADPAHPVTTVAGSGTAGFADGTGAAAAFNGPAGLAVGPDGTVYVADRNNHRVRAIAPDGAVRTLAGSDAVGLLDGDGSAARFHAPVGLAFDAAHQVLYVGDEEDGRVRAIDLATPGHARTSTYAGSDASGHPDGPAHQAAFGRPEGLAVDAAGHVYVADAGAGRLRRIAPDGSVMTMGGLPGSPRDDVITRAGGGAPVGLAATADGKRLAFTDADVHLVRLVRFDVPPQTTTPPSAPN